MNAIAIDAHQFGVAGNNSNASIKKGVIDLHVHIVHIVHIVSGIICISFTQVLTALLIQHPIEKFN